MACREIHRWTFCALVGAFLDLTLAYLLLCGSALAFLATKFLALFGLELPCPCSTGLFGIPTGGGGGGGRCLRGLLVNGPPTMIASVQMSVRNRFPFDSIWALDNGGGACGGDGGRSRPRFDVSLLSDGGGRGQQVRYLDMGDGKGEVVAGEEPRGSLLRGDSQLELGSGYPSSSSANGREQGVAASDDGNDRGVSGVKGKEALSGSKLPRPGLRRRRRVRKSSSPLFHGPPRLGWQGESCSPSPRRNADVRQQEISEEENSSPTHSSGHCSIRGSNSSGLVGDAPSDAGLNWVLGNAQAVENGVLQGNEMDTIRFFKQALEKEQTARADLLVELEKERSAAATATDEAMAMIERLQKEKATIDMNARQYQRMVEEKTTYDEEEMGILKEIILRRERELYVLGKEVEMYRQIMPSGEMNKQMPHSSFDPEDDPAVILQHLCDSMKRNEMIRRINGIPGDAPVIVRKEAPSMGVSEETCFLKPQDGVRAENLDSHHPEAPAHTEDDHLDFQEKGIVSVDMYTSLKHSEMPDIQDGPISCKLNGSQDHDFHQNVSRLVDEQDGEIHNKIKVRNPCESADREDGLDGRGRGNESYTSHSETEPITLDVHVIDDKITLAREGNGKENASQMGSASISSQSDLPFEPFGIKNIEISNGHSSTNCIEGELNIRRSSSDMTSVRPLDSSLSRAGSPFDLRRNSTSAVDNERLKLETEIEGLRRRLRIIQQGREKLNFSMENVEKENIQLQLLEEMALQLQEIRQLTETGKSTRQSSLPPPSSKVNS